MKWNRYSIKTTTQAVDLISSALDDIGIEGIEIQDNVQLTQEEAKTMFVDFIPELPPDDGTAVVNFYIDSDEENYCHDGTGGSCLDGLHQRKRRCERGIQACPGRYHDL